MEKLGEEEDEEKESATERRRKKTDIVSDLGESGEHVACHASALALGMTDDACREARCKPDNCHHYYEWRQKLYVFCLQPHPLQETTRLEIGV